MTRLITPEPQLPVFTAPVLLVVRVLAKPLSLSDHRRMRPVDHTQDASFGARRPRPIAETFAALDAGEHVIPVHRVTDCIAPDEKIAVHLCNRLVGDEEAVAVAMHADAAGDILFAAGGGGPIMVGELDDVAARGKALDGGFDLLFLLAALRAQELRDSTGA